MTDCAAPQSAVHLFSYLCVCISIRDSEFDDTNNVLYRREARVCERIATI